MARRLGLGQEFPMPYPGQSYGTVPDPAWKQRKYGKEWAIYDTVNATIGQGYMLVNPLQQAVMAARLASGRTHAAPANGPPRARRAFAWDPAGTPRSHPHGYERSGQRARALQARRDFLWKACRWPARPAPRKSLGSILATARAG